MTEFEKISTAACGTMMMGGAIASVVMLSQSAAESAAVGAEIACGSPGFQLAHNFVANSGTAVVCGPAGSLGLPGGICLPTTTATKATLTAKTATGLKAVVSTRRRSASAAKRQPLSHSNRLLELLLLQHRLFSLWLAQ